MQPFLFRADPELMGWLREEATRKHTTVTQLMRDLIVREKERRDSEDLQRVLAMQQATG